VGVLMARGSVAHPKAAIEGPCTRRPARRPAANPRPSGCALSSEPRPRPPPRGARQAAEAAGRGDGRAATPAPCQRRREKARILLGEAILVGLAAAKEPVSRRAVLAGGANRVAQEHEPDRV